jgi:TPR repeat protein
MARRVRIGRRAALGLGLRLVLGAALAAGCRKKPPSPAPEDAGVGSAFRLADGGVDRPAIAAELDRQCVGGNLEACRNLGILYQSGTGVAANPARAAALFAQACNGNNLAACNHLALALSEGMGIARDAPEAARCSRRRATAATR